MPCCYDFRSFLSHGVASGLLVSRTSRGKRPWPTSSNIFRVAHVYFFVLVVWCCTVQLGNFDVTMATMAFTCASSSSMCEASAVKVQLATPKVCETNIEKNVVSWMSTLWRPPNLKMPTICALPVPINLQSTICTDWLVAAHASRVIWLFLNSDVFEETFWLDSDTFCLGQVFVGHLQCCPGVNYGLNGCFLFAAAFWQPSTVDTISPISISASP